MPKLLFPETREHGPAEYHFSAEEIAEMAAWDEIKDYLKDNVEAIDAIKMALDVHRSALTEEDCDLRDRVASWLEQGMSESPSELLYLLWHHDKTIFDNEVEAWAKEEESKQ